MHIAILTFEGYNELDSLIALGILNRVKRPGWRVSITSPTSLITKPWVQEAGIEVLNQPLFVKGNIATAGGCAAG